VLFDLPAAGVAQNRLVGTHGPVGIQAGDWTPLEFHGDVVGAVVRTRARVKPIFVSAGHRVALADAIRFTLDNTFGYKLPAVIREAHALCNRVRRGLAIPSLELAV